MDSEKQRYKELADFLKTRRAKITPAQVGLPIGVRRRTPGLRREEVAQLAGIGLTWYTWLEQGRPIRVSLQIIESLSRVLMLNQNERTHLFTLAKQPLSASITLFSGSITPIIQHVLDHLVLCPAFVLDQRWQVIAWNKAACLVFEDFGKVDIMERNMIWRMFTNSDYKQLFINWEYHAQGILARFRSSCGEYVEDPWFFKFIEALKTKSEAFDLWWSKHEIQSDDSIYKEMMHPLVGLLKFEFSSFDISDTPGLRLIVNTPCSETDSASKIKQLQSDGISS